MIASTPRGRRVLLTVGTCPFTDRKTVPQSSVGEKRGLPLEGSLSPALAPTAGAQDQPVLVYSRPRLFRLPQPRYLDSQGPRARSAGLPQSACLPSKPTRDTGLFDAALAAPMCIVAWDVLTVSHFPLLQRG